MKSLTELQLKILSDLRARGQWHSAHHCAGQWGRGERASVSPKLRRLIGESRFDKANQQAAGLT